MSRASTIVPVDEYLHTTYEAECEYLDGEVRDRNTGETQHAEMMGLVAYSFHRRRKTLGIVPLIAVRVRIREHRYRVPDVCVLRGPLPDEDIVSSPPWIWIEILSRKDRFLPMAEKVREVLDFGCEWVWVIDPETLESRVYTKDSDYEPADGIFRIPGTEIAVPLHELEDQ